ncbi:LGFP repeat-containing protein [Sphaerisporangium aureirubrum]|uniref:LGFP repeat-containing protein n=1 Tax=Sphaerisporangium aureirubrum TaxID=1544736 RepID=A0ABW1NL56_9ACTN
MLTSPRHLARSRARRLALATAVAALTGVLSAGLPAQAATPATTAATPCDAALTPYGLIGEKWRDSGGQNSVFGCPRNAEYGFAGNHARRQDFLNGQIGWSPAIGPRTLVRVYAIGGKVIFRWGPTGRDWDFFNVRYEYLHEGVEQYKVGRIDPWNGVFSVPEGNIGASNGTIHYFSVQGCDNGGFLQRSDCGGWSLPVRL